MSRLRDFKAPRFSTLRSVALAEGPLLRARVRLGNLYNNHYDRTHAVDTVGQKAVAELDIESDNKRHGYGYGATPIGPFRNLMRCLDLTWDEYVFVDYGCGKGRTLFLAAEHPFRKIIGVEYAHDLVAIARLNIESFRHPRQRCFDLQCVQSDAIVFSPPRNENCLCYFYAPFDDVHFREVVATLTGSFAQTRQHLLICCARQVSHGGVSLSEVMRCSALFTERHLPDFPFDWLSHPQIEMTVYEIRQ